MRKGWMHVAGFDGQEKFAPKTKTDAVYIDETKTLDGWMANIKAELINLIYPVGTFYISAGVVSPGVLFGGTWEKIEGRFLLASSNEYANGSTGGSSTHTMTLAEMVHHGHHMEYQDANGNWQSASMLKRGNAQGNLPHVIGVDTVFDSNWQTNQRRIGGVGGSQPFSIMPPYIAVNVWKRIA